MGASDTTKDVNDPAVMYSARLKELQAAQTSDQNLERTFGYAKVAVAFATILAALILAVLRQAILAAAYTRGSICLSIRPARKAAATDSTEAARHRILRAWRGPPGGSLGRNGRKGGPISRFGASLRTRSGYFRFGFVI